MREEDEHFEVSSLGTQKDCDSNKDWSEKHGWMSQSV